MVDPPGLRYRSGDPVAVGLDWPDDIADIGDWSATVYALEYVVFGSEFYADDYDLSGVFQLGWDMEFLYVGLVVRDSKFVQSATGPQLFNGDSLEILLDTAWEADLLSDELSSDDYQLGFSPGNLVDVSMPESYIWAPSEIAGPLVNSVIQARLIEEGYMMEVAIPWEDVNVAPSDGLTLGFLLSISDNDWVNKNEQQTVVSFSTVRALHDPTTWGTLYPVMVVRMPPKKSRYLLPSASQTWRPSPRTIDIGSS